MQKFARDEANRPLLFNKSLNVYTLLNSHRYDRLLHLVKCLCPLEPLARSLCNYAKCDIREVPQTSLLSRPDWGTISLLDGIFQNLLNPRSYDVSLKGTKIDVVLDITIEDVFDVVLDVVLNLVLDTLIDAVLNAVL